MSVAERVQLMETATPVGTPAPAAGSIDNILRLALGGMAQRNTAPQAARPVDLDFGHAAQLLDRATDAIAALTARRTELEQAATLQEQVFADKLRAAQDEAQEWERRAKVVKGQVQDCEARLSEQQIRIEALTYRAENAEARLMMAEQLAADARKQAQMYHDKIVATFKSLV